MDEFAANVWADDNGHGTHVAGIVAALQNGSGTVGVAPEAKLLIGKVLALDPRTGDYGGDARWIAAGIDWAVQEGADIISMSLATPPPEPNGAQPQGLDVLHAAVQRAVRAGKIVIAAAGNDGRRDFVGFPGAFPECVCVGAVVADDPRTAEQIRADERGEVYRQRFPRHNVVPFSNSAQNGVVDVVAPGWFVYSSFLGGRTYALSGTSMATPYVAGAAALFVGQGKAGVANRTQADFVSAIAATSDSDVNLPACTPNRQSNPRSGWGRLRADRIVTGCGGVDPRQGGRTTLTTPPGFLPNGRILRLELQLDGAGANGGAGAGAAAPVQPLDPS